MNRESKLKWALILCLPLLCYGCQCARASKPSPEPGASSAAAGSSAGSQAAASGAGGGAAASGEAGGPENGGAASPLPSPAASIAAQGGSAKPRAKAPAAPVFGTDPGPHAGNVEVAITAEEGASLRYTLDGSLPGPKSGKPYAGPIPLDASATVTAVAFRDGLASKPAARNFTLKEICVAPGGTGPGRRDGPSGSIAAAIDAALGLGIASVKLASGEYRESVVVSSSISLSGGWAPGFAKRGGSGSAVIGVSGGDKADAPRAAFSVAGSSASLLLSRVELRCDPAAYTAGIFVKDGAQAGLSDCLLSGSSGTSSYAAKLVRKASISLASCRLSGGSADTCIGLSLDSSSARLLRCRVEAGSGEVVSYGVMCTSSNLQAASSAIYGGEANTSYGVGLYASPGGSLLACTIHGGRGKTAAYGIWCSQSSPAVKDCLIGAAGSAKSFGICENYGDSSPTALENNAFWGSSSGIYYDVDTKTAFQAVDAAGDPAGQGKALATPKGKGNLVFAGAIGPDLATPRDAALSSGGLSLDESAATDLAGKRRTEPWSIGAYELE